MSAPLYLGLIIRGRRRKLGLNQGELAEKTGVGRPWLEAAEHGKARAEIGHVLRTISALGLPLPSTETAATARLKAMTPSRRSISMSSSRPSRESPMTDVVVALADGHVMGEICRSPAGRFAFFYDEDWRASRRAYPLSLPMPLVVGEREHGRIESRPWLRPG